MFDSSAQGPVELSAPVETTRYHDVIRLSYASNGFEGRAGNVVEALYFKSRTPGAKKLVVVLPIWGVTRYPSSKVSRGYATHSRGDAQVIWVLGDARLFPWDELSSAATEAQFADLARDSAERYRAAVVDMRRLLDWAETRPEIDMSRIAFVGFSMSALVTTTLMGNDDRVRTAVLMMGAANFADVFASCGDRLRKVREHALRDYGWSLAEYHDFFEGLFGPADPVRYPGRYDRDRILMIDARFDDCMPKSSRNALWELTGRPERITFLYRHRSSFFSLTPLGLNFSRRTIYAFLDRTL